MGWLREDVAPTSTTRVSSLPSSITAFQTGGTTGLISYAESVASRTTSTRTVTSTPSPVSSPLPSSLVAFQQEGISGVIAQAQNIASTVPSSEPTPSPSPPSPSEVIFPNPVETFLPELTPVTTPTSPITTTPSPAPPSPSEVIFPKPVVRFLPKLAPAPTPSPSTPTPTAPTTHPKLNPYSQLFLGNISNIFDRENRFVVGYDVAGFPVTSKDILFESLNAPRVMIGENRVDWAINQITTKGIDEGNIEYLQTREAGYIPTSLDVITGIDTIISDIIESGKLNLSQLIEFKKQFPTWKTEYQVSKASYDIGLQSIESMSKGSYIWIDINKDEIEDLNEKFGFEQKALALETYKQQWIIKEGDYAGKSYDEWFADASRNYANVDKDISLIRSNLVDISSSKNVIFGHYLAGYKINIEGGQYSFTPPTAKETHQYLYPEVDFKSDNLIVKGAEFLINKLFNSETRIKGIAMTEAFPFVVPFTAISSAIGIPFTGGKSWDIYEESLYQKALNIQIKSGESIADYSGRYWHPFSESGVGTNVYLPAITMGMGYVFSGLTLPTRAEKIVKTVNRGILGIGVVSTGATLVTTAITNPDYIWKATGDVAHAWGSAIGGAKLGSYIYTSRIPSGVLTSLKGNIKGFNETESGFKPDPNLDVTFVDTPHGQWATVRHSLWTSPTGKTYLHYGKTGVWMSPEAKTFYESPNIKNITPYDNSGKYLNKGGIWGDRYRIGQTRFKPVDKFNMPENYMQLSRLPDTNSFIYQSFKDTAIFGFTPKAYVVSKVYPLTVGNIGEVLNKVDLTGNEYGVLTGERDLFNRPIERTGVYEPKVIDLSNISGKSLIHATKSIVWKKGDFAGRKTYIGMIETKPMDLSFEDWIYNRHFGSFRELGKKPLPEKWYNEDFRVIGETSYVKSISGYRQFGGDVNIPSRYGLKTVELPEFGIHGSINVINDRFVNIDRGWSLSQKPPKDVILPTSTAKGIGVTEIPKQPTLEQEISGMLSSLSLNQFEAEGLTDLLKIYTESDKESLQIMDSLTPPRSRYKIKTDVEYISDYWTDKKLALSSDKNLTDFISGKTKIANISRIDTALSNISKTNLLTNFKVDTSLRTVLSTDLKSQQITKTLPITILKPITTPITNIKTITQSVAKTSLSNVKVSVINPPIKPIVIPPFVLPFLRLGGSGGDWGWSGYWGKSKKYRKSKTINPFDEFNRSMKQSKDMIDFGLKKNKKIKEVKL